MKHKHAGGRPIAKKIKLKPHERGKLEKIINNKSEHEPRQYQRALMLLRLAQGEGVTDVAQMLGISRNAVMERRNFYLNAGLERALMDAPGRGRKREIQPEDEAQIVAIACTAPPAGASHWSCRLLAAEVKKRGILDTVSSSAVHVILQRHELKPWREKNVVRG
jgi:transposase